MYDYNIMWAENLESLHLFSSCEFEQIIPNQTNLDSGCFTTLYNVAALVGL